MGKLHWHPPLFRLRHSGESFFVAKVSIWKHRSLRGHQQGGHVKLEHRIPSNFHCADSDNRDCGPGHYDRPQRLSLKYSVSNHPFLSTISMSFSQELEDEFKDVFGIGLDQKLDSLASKDDFIEKFVTAILGGADKGDGVKLNQKEKAKAEVRAQLVTDLQKHMLKTKDVPEFLRFLKEKVASIDLKNKSGGISRKESSVSVDTGGELVIGRLLKDLISLVFHKEASEVEDTAVEDAAEANAKQVKRLSEKGTIWHAVSSFGTDEGHASWRLVKIVNKLLLHGEEDSDEERKKALAAPWMKGDDRGNFGETPLHIALLFNIPGDKLTQFFEELWDMFPHLHEAEYTEALYHGENALHIAIIKKAGLTVIKRIVESEAGESLLKGKSDGAFFKQEAYSGGACHNLGEYPLCFAACTNQPDVFKYLIEKGADLKVTTSEGHNLLHLMVLNAFNRNSAGEGEAEAGDKEKEGGKTVEDAYKGMYDEIVSCLKKVKTPEGTLFDKLRSDRNNDGHTPLTLAAARGSLSFFTHLFSQEVGIAWIYGPVTCRKLYLEGIDTSLDEEVKAAVARKKAASAQAGKDEGGRDYPDLSVLEILVLNARKDILTNSQVGCDALNTKMRMIITPIGHPEQQTGGLYAY